LVLPVPVLLIENQSAFNPVLETFFIGLGGYPTELMMSMTHLIEADYLSQPHLPNLISIDYPSIKQQRLHLSSNSKFLFRYEQDNDLSQPQTSLLLKAI